jgi:hypothetical protein
MGFIPERLEVELPQSLLMVQSGTNGTWEIDTSENKRNPLAWTRLCKLINIYAHPCAVWKAARAAEREVAAAGT